MKKEDVENQFGYAAIMKQEELINHLESAHWLLWKVKDAGDRAKIDWLKGDVEVILDKIRSLKKVIEAYELELEEHGIERE